MRLAVLMSAKSGYAEGQVIRLLGARRDASSFAKRTLFRRLSMSYLRIATRST